MEHILHSNIMDHLEEHNILTDAQHGFRCKRSCETQLIATIQKIARGLSEGKQLDVILLGFAKAFDKVPHQRLLYKLNYYGVRGQTLSWIESFLRDRATHLSGRSQIRRGRGNFWGTPGYCPGTPFVPGLYQRPSLSRGFPS